VPDVHEELPALWNCSNNIYSSSDERLVELKGPELLADTMAVGHTRSRRGDATSAIDALRKAYERADEQVGIEVSM
jgi:hypothetical protein